MSHPASGGVTQILRFEGMCLFILSLLLYAQFGQSWAIFAVLFFMPDLALLGYLASQRTGNVLYNFTHSYVGPLLMACSGALTKDPFFIMCAVIWLSHLSFDRMLGFGLKTGKGFRHTHLGHIGQENVTRRK